MNFDEMVAAVGDLPTTVLAVAGMRVCPVCLGSGTVWLSEHESNWLGTAVQCWECNGVGTRCEPTTTEAR